MNKKILIGGAWPYANGSLHIGHIAGLLPGDIIARYYRANGEDVYYVSGSDCSGTPIAIREEQEGKTPEAVSEHYHSEFKYCFKKLGFSFDVYGKTSQAEHVEFVREFYRKLYLSDYVYENYHFADYIISNEYLTLEGRKISTSRNWAVWVKDIIERYDPDSLRYFFIANGPEKRDTDFSWQEFAKVQNGELLGNYGNFINRTLVFIRKYFSGSVPEGVIPFHTVKELDQVYEETGYKIREGRLKEALEGIFHFIHAGNKYFDAQAPWLTRNGDIRKCKNTLYNCVLLAVNYGNLLVPFLPFSSEKVLNWFGMKPTWNTRFVPAGYVIPETGILFKHIEKSTVEEEVNRGGGINRTNARRNIL